MSPMSLRAEAVHIKRGPARLLRGVTLCAEVGAITAILGANGAGKSTLLGALSGDLTPSHGEVSWRGRALSSFTCRQLALERAVVLQHTTLSFDLTVREVVALGRAPHPPAHPHHEHYITHAMRQVRVEHLAQRSYVSCSGGERQRVHLARALAQLLPLEHDTPRFLLLDEPTASLDMAHALECLGTLAQLARQGIGVVVVLHDPNLAARFAHHVVVLKRGECVAAGSPTAVLTPALFAHAFEARVEVLHPAHMPYPVIVPCDALAPSPGPLSTTPSLS